MQISNNTSPENEIQTLKNQLGSDNFNPKTCWNWDNEDSIQELIINLNQTKANLETQISQAISSHILGRQRTLKTIRQVIPQLNLDVKIEQPEHKIDGLLEIIQVKKRVDVCLAKLNQILDN